MPKSSSQPAARSISLAAVARRPRWREEHARVVVAAWKDSGLTMREFSASNSVPQKRLERWSCKLRKRDNAQPKEALQFLPIEVAGAAPTRAEHEPGEDFMELSLPTGVRVTLGAGFDADALKRLLLVVGC